MRLGNPYPEKDSYTTVQITPAYWTPDDGYQTGHFVELRGYGAVGNNSNTLNSRIPMDEVIGWAELPDRSEISFAPITSELCQKSTT